jgi:uncharacterized protein YjbI with pentapeptide repeats
MKIVKPVKVPVVTRVVEIDRRPRINVAAMIGFPLDAPRAILDELAFWAAVTAELGEQVVIDGGVAKARGELLVAGSFHAPTGEPVTASYVRAKLGPIDKQLAVFGDRYWHDETPSEPERITTIPIDWAHAFGGEHWQRNPHGKGAPLPEVDDEEAEDAAEDAEADAEAAEADAEAAEPDAEGSDAPADQAEGDESDDEGGESADEADAEATEPPRPLPNIENYGQIISSPTDEPEPAGLGPMDVTFGQRRDRAGTFDAAWAAEVRPGMPLDMDPTFFNAAPEDQWLDGFFSGDEELAIDHMHPSRPRIEGRLPGLVARCFVTQRTVEGERFIEIPMRCDTVWLLPGAELGVVIFHGAALVADDDAADVLHLVVACEDPAQPRAAEHYQQALHRRLDKDKGAIAELSDSDLMPPRETGVAPNMAETDVGRWTKSENLVAANQRRGAERRRAEQRAAVVAAGQDPAAYGLDEPLPEEPAPPADDPDALAEYLAEQQAQGDEEIKKLDQQRAEAEQRLEQLAADGDDDVMAELTGPPKFSAAKHLQMMLDMLDLAREGGEPQVELELQVHDPDYQAALIRQEEQVRDLYRRGAHLQPAASPDEQAGAQARVVVQAALDSRTSLAGRDLTGAKLAGMKLAGVDLTGAMLEGADMAGCDLTDAKLENAVLAHANLRGATLSGALLCGANLGKAALQGARFDRADLTEGILSRTDLAGVRFADAKLDGAELLETSFGNVDLSGASLSKCNMLQADLAGANLTRADLSHSHLVECQLDGADLSGAKLEQTTFVTCRGERVRFREARFRQGVMAHGSAFPQADFRDAELEDANLRGTALGHARFDRARLSGADLSECDVTEGSFQHALLKGAVLIRSKLDRAVLQGANLMDALLSKASVQGTSFFGANLFRADLNRLVSDDETCFDEAELTQPPTVPEAELDAPAEPDAPDGGSDPPADAESTEGGRS